MKTIIPLLLLVAVALAADKSRSGPAVSAGIGNLHGGLGVCFEYQVRVRPLLRFTPFGSLGFATPIYGGDIVIGPGFCVGVNAEIGRMHRLFMGPSFGAQYLDYDVDPQNHYSNLNVVVGPALVAGYKGTARFGLMWLLYAGAAYPVNETHWRPAYSLIPAFGLGLGYKF